MLPLLTRTRCKFLFLCRIFFSTCKSRNKAYTIANKVHRIPASNESSCTCLHHKRVFSTRATSFSIIILYQKIILFRNFEKKKINITIIWINWFNWYFMEFMPISCNMFSPLNSRQKNKSNTKNTHISRKKKWNSKIEQKRK